MNDLPLKHTLRKMTIFRNDCSAWLLVGGMRIGEVLKLTLSDIQDRKLILRDPKSGKDHEIVFIPQKVADRLRNYASQECKHPQDRIRYHK
jgi:integrase